MARVWNHCGCRSLDEILRPGSSHTKKDDLLQLRFTGKKGRRSPVSIDCLSYLSVVHSGPLALPLRYTFVAYTSNTLSITFHYFPR
jgi:hypothetical protein